MSRQADCLAELLPPAHVWLMQAQLKSTSADFGCPDIISQIWEQGLPYVHLSWLHDFWPAHWRRCTALCLIQNILWKSSKHLMDRLRTPLAKRQIPQFLLSLLPLLSLRNLVQNIICGQEAVKLLENTQPQSENPNLRYYTSFFVHCLDNKLNWSLVVLSCVCVLVPHWDSLPRLYSQNWKSVSASFKHLWKQHSELIPRPFFVTTSNTTAPSTVCSG